MDTENAKMCIGRMVAKSSRKPFKSGNKINTVKDVVTNSYTGRVAFTFEEDDSCVECRMCRELTEEELTAHLETQKKLSIEERLQMISLMECSIMSIYR